MSIGTNWFSKRACILIEQENDAKAGSKPPWAGTRSQADRFYPSKGRLLSCLSESWHFWVLFVLLVITLAPLYPVACSLVVWHHVAYLSSFLAHPCCSCAAPVHAWGQKLLHGDQCCQFIFAHGCCWMSWVLNKPLLVLHFVCIWTGWDWDGGGRFYVVFVWLCLLLFVVFLFFF